MIKAALFPKLCPNPHTMLLQGGQFECTDPTAPYGGRGEGVVKLAKAKCTITFDQDCRFEQLVQFGSVECQVAWGIRLPGLSKRPGLQPTQVALIPRTQSPRRNTTEAYFGWTSAFYGRMYDSSLFVYSRVSVALKPHEVRLVASRAVQRASLLCYRGGGEVMEGWGEGGVVEGGARGRG